MLHISSNVIWNTFTDVGQLMSVTVCDTVSVTLPVSSFSHR